MGSAASSEIVGQTGGGHNAMRLLWAGFMAILAAGVGFAIRGGIFDNWGSEFGFTNEQLGAIGGAGFSGFCFGIIVGGMLCDRWGYGKLVIVAFLCHVLSAFVTFAATGSSAYQFLFWGMFIFAYANGTLEAVANPLVATLFPQNRTHYLNILHASWPAGLIVGGALGWILDDMVGLHWKYQLALYLVPTAIYGLMFLGQSYPKSEASKQGLSLGEMLQEVGLLGGLVVCFLLALFFADSVFKPLTGNPETARYLGYGIGGALLIGMGVLTRFSTGSLLMFVLFVTHALVGAVELGTDQWIQNITGNILTSQEGKILFVWTSAVMFALRFCAHWIEKNLRLSPVGLLFVCSLLAVLGLNMASAATAFLGAMAALTIYGIGKTFFWPTMLAVASDRFPRTGAVAISIMGGIGMMSAGLIGSPGLGYAKDRFAAERARQASPAIYEQYQSETTSTFLFFDEIRGLDGRKMGAIKDKPEADRSEDERTVLLADQDGTRQVLRADAFIPATMAVIYLALMLYFQSIGGYKPETIDPESITGGTLGPGEA
jgi:MFS family permease